jgi:SAM-dependent methyltransferase
MNEEITEFFGKTWTQTEVDPRVVRILGDAKHVIDVGCGFNPYKQFHENLIGVDIVNEKADVNCDILDFPNDNKFDLAICFGILHFNSYEWIRERLEWVVDHTTPDAQILMKVNPSRKEDQAEELQSSDVVWFDKWNRGLADHFADIYSLEVLNWREWRNPLDNSLRLKFDYIKRS